MDERTIERIFLGSLIDLPPINSKIVRIFTSSTFTDMSLERNTLMEDVYPKIKEYCKEKYGLEFQVVDMRWGVRDESTDDHMTTELCMKEIENCQRLSMGPNFVAFLGQKYGYRPIPTVIDGKEYRLLRNTLEDLEISEAELFDMWYREDTNAVPPVFILQPISSILTNFTNRLNLTEQSKDQFEWRQTLHKLQTLLRIAANYLHKKGFITEDAKHNYIMSVTEREITNGILKVTNVKRHCLAYIRNINKIDMSVIGNIEKFIDLTTKGDVDKEAQKLINDLRDRKLTQKMNSSNIAKFNVDWIGNEGLCLKAHSYYLQELSDHFYRNITKMVQKAMGKEVQTKFGKVVTEILHHSHSSLLTLKVFIGREDELNAIKNYVENESQLPLVLHGNSGCGKTSLLAKAASLLDDWLGTNEKNILILRFIGTTPDSSSVIPLLTSICQQISYNFSLPLNETPEDLVGLVFFFKQLILQTSQQRLFIFIDSVDQLSGNRDSSIKLSWLAQQFPINVKVVISCSSNNCNDFEFLKRIIDDTNQYLEVKPLGADLAIRVIKSWLNLSERDLTANQWEIVKNVINECSLPIFTKLVFAEVIRWKSYSKSSITVLSNSVMDSIMSLFNRIEVSHGRAIVSHALSYITASKVVINQYNYLISYIFSCCFSIKNGLSESELEDLLSLDDIVLDDVYQYHVPPVRRIPPLLWTRIRNDLPQYLTERDADGVNAMNWYHRQFKDASVQRYFQNSSDTIFFHSSIVDYFLGIWGGGNCKPFKYTEIQKQRFSLRTEEATADRKVPTQPLAYYGIDGKLIRYNIRKLGELPYHLVRAQRYHDLLRLVLFNYNWLHAKLSCFPLQSVLHDFEDVINYDGYGYSLDHSIRKEISLLADTLRLSAPVLAQYTNMLSPQIIARLLPLSHQYPNINFLLRMCDEYGAQHCALLPVNHCLHTPGGPLMYSLEGHQFAVFDFALTSDNRYVISTSNRFIVWDLSTAEISRDVDPEIKGIMMALIITSDDKFAITYTNYNEIIILNVLSSEVKILTQSDTNLDNNIVGLSTVNDFSFMSWTCDEWIIVNVKHSDYKIDKYTLSQYNHSEVSMKLIIVSIVMSDDNERHMIYQQQERNTFYLETIKENKCFKPIEFYGGFALNSRKTILFYGNETGSVCFRRRKRNKWQANKTLSKSDPPKGNELISLLICGNDEILVAVYLRCFTIWWINPIADHSIQFQLPTGVRNISIRPLKSFSCLVMTRSNQYAIGGVRKCIYVWSTQTGDLLNILDAHYGRIIHMTSLIVKNQYNAVISSSFDKTIKVWNIANLFERVHTIDRMELPIDSISFSSLKNIAITATRSCIGVWCLDTGKLLTTLSDSKIGAILTHAVITDNGKYVISTECSNFLIWDLEKELVVYKQEQNNVKHVMLTDNDTNVVTIEVFSDQTNVSNTLLLKRSVPDGNVVYTIKYFTLIFLKAKLPVITKDNQYIVISVNDKKNPLKECLEVHSMKNGVLLHSIKLENIKYNELKSLIYRGRGSVVGLCGHESCIIDVYTKRTLTKISRWNGCFTNDGTYGLFAPSSGGLELIELRNGETVKVLLPRTTEGVISLSTDFTASDQYVYYYHAFKKTIRLIRLTDGKIIANYKLSAEARIIKSTPDGSNLVVGGVDGNFIILFIADFERDGTRKRLSELPSRLPALTNARNHLQLGRQK